MSVKKNQWQQLLSEQYVLGRLFYKTKNRCRNSPYIRYLSQLRTLLNTFVDFHSSHLTETLQGCFLEIKGRFVCSSSLTDPVKVQTLLCQAVQHLQKIEAICLLLFRSALLSVRGGVLINQMTIVQANCSRIRCICLDICLQYQKMLESLQPQGHSVQFLNQTALKPEKTKTKTGTPQPMKGFDPHNSTGTPRSMKGVDPHNSTGTPRPMKGVDPHNSNVTKNMDSSVTSSVNTVDARDNTDPLNRSVKVEKDISTDRIYQVKDTVKVDRAAYNSGEIDSFSTKIKSKVKGMNLKITKKLKAVNKSKSIDHKSKSTAVKSKRPDPQIDTDTAASIEQPVSQGRKKKKSLSAKKAHKLCAMIDNAKTMGKVQHIQKVLEHSYRVDTAAANKFNGAEPLKSQFKSYKACLKNIVKHL